jgi:C4-dicarboxylate transporter DctQ subunit
MSREPTAGGPMEQSATPLSSAGMAPADPVLAEAREVRVLPRLWVLFEERLLLNIATGVMLLAMGIMFWEAVNRSLYSRSHWWAEESVRFLVVWAVLFSLGPATRRHHFIRMDLIVNAVGRRVRLALAWANALCGLVFALVLTWTGILAAQHLRRMRMMTDSNLDLPMWIIHLALPIGAALYALHFLLSALALLRGYDPNETIAT